MGSSDRPTCMEQSQVLATSCVLSLRHFIIWLAPRAGKMNQTARCDWLPERARWSDLARSGLPAASRKQNFTKSHIMNSLLTKFVRSRWPDIGLVLFLRIYGPRRSRSINTQKKNLANIQPSDLTLGQYPIHTEQFSLDESLISFLQLFSDV